MECVFSEKSAPFHLPTLQLHFTYTWEMNDETIFTLSSYSKLKLMRSFDSENVSFFYLDISYYQVRASQTRDTMGPMMIALNSSCCDVDDDVNLSFDCLSWCLFARALLWVNGQASFYVSESRKVERWTFYSLLGSLTRDCFVNGLQCLIFSYIQCVTDDVRQTLLCVLLRSKKEAADMIWVLFLCKNVELLWILQ